MVYTITALLFAWVMLGVRCPRCSCWWLLANGVIKLSPGSRGNVFGFCCTGDSVTFSASGNFTVWSLNHLRLPDQQECFDCQFALPAKLNIKLRPHPQEYLLKSQDFTDASSALSSLYWVSFLIKNPEGPFKARFLQHRALAFNFPSARYVQSTRAKMEMPK